MNALKLAPMLVLLSGPAWATTPESTDTDLGDAVRELVQDVGGAVEDMARQVDEELAQAERDAAAAGDVQAMEDIREGREGLVELVRELKNELSAVRDELRQVQAEVEQEIHAELVDVRSEVVLADLERRSIGSIREYSNDVVIKKDTVVDDVEAFSGDIEVLGVVRRNAKTFSGDVIIRNGGKVLGNASTLSGDVIVEPGGLLEGVAQTFSGDLVVEPGGVLAGTRVHHTPHVEASGSWLADAVWGLYRRLVFLLAFAGAGILVVALFPERVRRVAHTLEQQPARAGLLGLAWTVGIVVASVLFFWTVLGPLVGMAVLGVAWMLGFVGLCQMLGDRLPFSYKPHGRWLAFLVGSVLMSCLGALPWVGFLTVIAASLFGIGAVFVSRFGSEPA